MLMSMGDPITAALVPVAINWLTSFLAPAPAALTPAAPSAIAVAELMRRQEEARQAAARSRNAWIIGGSLVGVGVLALVVVRARK